MVKGDVALSGGVAPAAAASSAASASFSAMSRRRAVQAAARLSGNMGRRPCSDA